MTTKFQQLVSITTETDEETRYTQYDQAIYEGQMEVTEGAVVVSDPCYTEDVWCMLPNVKLPSGIYNCYSMRGSYDVWGDRVRAIMILNNTVKAGSDFIYFGKELDLAGVDSGQLGFYDKPKYRKGATEEHFKQFSGDDFRYKDWCRTWEECSKESNEEKFYNAVSNCSLCDHACGVIRDLGFTSSSGFGDGSYPIVELLDKKGNRVGLRADFVADDDYYIESEED